MNRKHGMYHSKEWRAWVHARGRCERPTDNRYAKYGGRGIRFCERWRSFEAFLADMGPCPPGHTLDRINNDGNYEPGNCRWATRTTQNRNTTQNVTARIRGEVLCGAEIAQKYSVSQHAVYRRLKRGLDGEELLASLGVGSLEAEEVK